VADLLQNKKIAVTTECAAHKPVAHHGVTMFLVETDLR
jgi:hypothetical protein